MWYFVTLLRLTSVTEVIPISYMVDTFSISALHLSIKVPYFSNSGHKNEKVTSYLGLQAFALSPRPIYALDEPTKRQPKFRRQVGEQTFFPLSQHLLKRRRVSNPPVRKVSELHADPQGVTHFYCNAQQKLASAL
eukprot:SAG31_NODE_2063_length_6535_cov_7.578931_3_plen_135_part_00